MLLRPARIASARHSTGWGIPPGTSRSRRTGSGHEEIQGVDEVLSEVPPVDDGVDHAVLQQKLRALETFGQLLSNRLLDDTRSGESYQGSRLSEIEIAQHRE